MHVTNGILTGFSKVNSAYNYLEAHKWKTQS